MKTNKLRLAVAVVCSSLFVSVGFVTADAGKPPGPTAPGGTLDQRIAQRKAERGTSLSADDVQRVTGACVEAQTKLRAIENDEVNMLGNRNKVYGNIDAKLWIVTGQLKLANQDTFNLEKQRLTLLDKSNNFKSISTYYKQALDDSLLINCQADPNGFQALVDTARIYHDQLRAQAADSNNYIVNTVKQTLSGFVDSLQQKSPTQGD